MAASLLKWCGQLTLFSGMGRVEAEAARVCEALAQLFGVPPPKVKAMNLGGLLGLTIDTSIFVDENLPKSLILRVAAHEFGHYLFHLTYGAHGPELEKLCEDFAQEVEEWASRVTFVECECGNLIVAATPEAGRLPELACPSCGEEYVLASQQSTP